MSRPVLASILALVVAVPGAAAQTPEDAQTLYRGGDREGAGRVIRAWAAENPGAAQSAEITALLARTAEDPNEAVGLWDQVLALDPDEDLAAEAHWTKGVYAYSAGRYVAAAHEFVVLGDEYGGSFPHDRARLWKGCAELGADKPEEAIESLRAARRSGSDEEAASAEFGIAHAYMRLGQVAEALRRYDRFERDYPDDARASAAARRAVECLRLLGRESEATVRATQIERDYPRSLEATLSREATRDAREEDREGTEPAGGSARYVVQVASMSDATNATRLAQRVRRLELGDVKIERAEGPEGVMHRVLVGPFDEESRARAVADSVALLGDLTPRVRQEPKR